MEYLSYSTMTELIDCPHSWICKQMGLKRREYAVYKQGTDAHRIIQEHVSGKKLHPALVDLPTFDVVEDHNMDDKCKIDFVYDDKVVITGYFDGYSTEREELLEAKSYGASEWTVGRFFRLDQWRLYILGLLHQGRNVHNLCAVTMPRNLATWSRTNVHVYRIPAKREDIDRAEKFIEHALFTIDNIETLAYQQGKKRCEYIDCPFGCDATKQPQPQRDIELV